MSLKRRVVVVAIIGLVALTGWILLDRAPSPSVADLRQISDPLEALAPLDSPKVAPLEGTSSRTDGTPKPPAEASSGAMNEKAFFGRVVDGEGIPIPGVRVAPPDSVTTITDDNRAVIRTYWSQAPAIRVTDQEGRFRFDLAGWKEDEFILQFEHDEFVSRVPQVVVPVGDEVTVEMLRLLQGAVNLQVFSSASGDPLQRFGAAVYTMVPPATEEGSGTPTRRWPGSRSLTVDGTLTIDPVGFLQGLPVQIELFEVVGIDYKDPRVRASLSCDVNLTAGAVTQVRMTVDDGSDERDPSRTIVRGVVIDDETEAGLSGVYVHVGPKSIRVSEQTSRSARKVQTRLDGSFQIAVPQDDSSGEVTFQHPAYDDLTSRYLEGEESTYRLKRRGSISVRVVDGIGAPVAECWVLLWCGPNETKKRVTDRDGRVEFDGLKSGKVYVFVLRSERSSDDDALANGSWTIASGEHREVTLEVSLDPLVTVRGRVFGSGTGSPMFPLFIALADGGGWIQSRLEPSGEYFAEGLSRGEHYVMILPDDDSSQPYAFLPPVMIEGVANQQLDLQIPSGMVRGFVSPAPVQDERVVARPVDAWAAHLGLERILGSDKLVRYWGVPVDSTGEFKVERLAAGRYRLELRRGSEKVATREVEISGAGSLVDVGVWNVEL